MGKVFIPLPSIFDFDAFMNAQKGGFMADIKTRDIVKGTIKTLDKSAIAADRMRSANAKTKERAEEAQYAVDNLG